MDQIGNELKKMLKAGLGAVAAGAEKAQEAIETLSQKGEPLYQQAKSAVSDAAGKVAQAVNEGIQSIKNGPDVTDVIDRADLALLLERIDMCNPACIGVDLIFEGRKDDEQADAYLGEVAERISEKAVFAVKLTDYDSQTGAFAGATHSFFTGEHPVAEGYVNFINNLDAQPVRDLSTSRETAEGPVASFPAVLAERYAGRDLGFGERDRLRRRRRTL